MPAERRYWSPLGLCEHREDNADDDFSALQNRFLSGLVLPHGNVPQFGEVDTAKLLGVVLTRRKEKGKRSLLCEIGKHQESPVSNACLPLRVLLAIRESSLDPAERMGEGFDWLLKELRRGAIVSVVGSPFVSGAGVATLLCHSVKLEAPAPARDDAAGHKDAHTNMLQAHRYQAITHREKTTRPTYLRSGAPGQAGRSRRETSLHRWTFLWRELGWRDATTTTAHSVSKLSKSERHEAFAAWIVHKFGPSALRRGSGVLDVAGGKGLLTYELTAVHGIPCTLIEPRPASVIERHEMGEDHSGHVDQWQGMLTMEAVASDPRLHRLVSDCSLIIGLSSG